MLNDEDFQRSDHISVGAFGPAMVMPDLDVTLLAEASRVGIREVVIGGPTGELGSLRQLLQIPDLIGLRLLPGRALTRQDWEVIEQLVSLRYLSLGHDRVGGAFDVGRLTRLEWFIGPWWPGLQGLDHIGLVGLNLRRVKSAASIDRLVSDRLRSLSVVGDVGEDLSALAAATNIQSLEVARCPRLRSLRGVERCRSLEEIAILGAKALADVGDLGHCAAVTRVLLEDCPAVESLRMPADARWEGVWLLGKTNVEDGDLGWMALAGLREAFVSKRRHYTLECDELPSAPAWELFDRPPSFAHRPPAIREYWRIQQATYGRERLYPAWFRGAYPQLCV